MLNVLKYSDTLDWQNKGHFSNFRFGAKYSPTIKLLPFMIKTSTGVAVSEFKAWRVEPLEASVGVKILETIDINTALVEKSAGIFNDTWYYKASANIDGVLTGLWQFYIKFSDGSEYHSELMQVPCAGEIIECLPDFNDDFSNDFLTCESVEMVKALYNYGYLYNWYAVDTGKLAPTGYRVPSSADCNTLMAYLGGTNAAGSKLKSTRTSPDLHPRFDTPNTDATNDYGMHFLPGGYRLGTNGLFSLLGQVLAIYTTDATLNTYAVIYNQTIFANVGSEIKAGHSIRVMRDASVFEQTQADGTVIETIYDEDGNFYKGIKIGTQVWFNQNLKTTKYNDGTDITEITDDGDWAADTTGAYCSYNNDPLTTYEDSEFYYYE